RLCSRDDSTVLSPPALSTTALYWIRAWNHLSFSFPQIRWSQENPALPWPARLLTKGAPVFVKDAVSPILASLPTEKRPHHPHRRARGGRFGGGGQASCHAPPQGKPRGGLPFAPRVRIVRSRIVSSPTCPG